MPSVSLSLYPDSTLRDLISIVYIGFSRENDDYQYCYLLNILDSDNGAMVNPRVMSEISNSQIEASGWDGKVEIQAHAKVNLYLEVLGERDDGYHDIRSVVAQIMLHDTVCLESISKGVETTWENGKGADLVLACPEDNIVTKAAIILMEMSGYSGGVRIHLKKKVPVGGGFGGGSSDAASVLVALNRLLGIDLGMAKLMEVGATLGCDVPSLVHGGVVVMEGLGEKVTKLDVGCFEDGLWLVLVNPGLCISTKDIYSRCRSSLTSERIPFRSMVSALRSGDVNAVAGGLFNGLQETVFLKYPIVAMVADGLKNAGANGVLLSGSGASVFGIANDEAHAHAILERLKKENGVTYWCDVTRILPDGVTVAHGPLTA